MFERFEQWLLDILRSGHSLRRQLFSAVVLTTLLSGLSFAVLDYVRERDFLLDAMEQLAATRFDSELVHGSTSVQQFWQKLTANSDTLLAPIYLVAGDQTLGDLESVPEPTAGYKDMTRRDVITSDVVEDLQLMQVLRRTRVWDNRVELHLRVRPGAGAPLAIAFAVPGLDLHLLGSYFRNALWLLLASILAGTVLYFLLSLWLVRRVRLLIDKFRSIENGILPAPLPVEGNDEFETLNRGFNHMVEELKRTNRLTVELQQEQKKRADDAVTHKEELERARIISAEQRFAALGRLSSGIAHEINNPLTFIAGAIHPLSRKLNKLLEPLDETERRPIQELLTAITEGANRATQIVSDMRQLTQGGGAHETVSLQQSIQQSLRLTHLEKRGNREVVLELPDHDIKVRVSAGLMLQVWSNLLLNAYEATVDGDLIQISVTAQDAQASVVIQDSGSGWAKTEMDPTEPFATSKAEGSGLGLALCRSIVEGAQGKLVLSDSTLGGARATVLLPIAGNDQEADDE